MDSARSLADWLRGRGDDELAALLTARPDLANPVPPDVSALAARATTRTSVLRALDSLDQHRHALAEALVLLPEPVSLDEVAGLLGDALGPPEVLREALDRLRALALVWGDDDELHLVRAVRELIVAPAGVGPSVAAAVGQYPALYRALVDSLDLPRTATVADIQRRVAEVMSDPAAIRERIDALPPPLRELLERLTWARGTVRDAWRYPDSPLTDWQQLMSRGLLVAIDQETLVVPQEVAHVLRDGRLFRPGYADRPEVAASERPTGLVDRTAAGQAMTVVSALEDLLDAWGVAPPSVLRSGGLGVRELRRAARDLDLAEPVLALLLEAAYAAGLLAPTTDADPVWLPTPAFDGWTRSTPAQRWAALAAAWTATPRAAGLVGSTGDRRVNVLSADVEWPAVTGVRETVLRLLADLPPGAAPDPDSVVELVGWLAPRRPTRQLTTAAQWTLTEAEALGVTGAGALSGFGRRLVAGDEAGAAEVLAPLLPAPVDHVLVQADLTAVAPGPLVPELARELRLAADVESTGGATVYRFTEASVRRALDAGRSAAELHQLLDRRSRTPVPQPLHYLIDDVARRHGRIRVGTAQTYVRADDPAVLQEVLAARGTRDLGLRLLAPTVLAATAPVERVLESLRALGHAPVPESAAGEVVVRRPSTRRAPARGRPPRYGEPVPLAPELVRVAVNALRAGDRAVTHAPRLRRPVSPAEALTALYQAAADGRALWIGYLNAEGEASQRMIEPRVVVGGQVTAYDHRSGEVRTFLVHRVTGVAPADEG